MRLNKQILISSKRMCILTNHQNKEKYNDKEYKIQIHIYEKGESMEIELYRHRQRIIIIMV